ncbi:MAG: saccharopine dehydrogenase NADP-binding domain-containing protein [Cyanobacteriota bacterium]|nr:saccharopine dehydrogenase NADP-binding domain-containing protein [Cyanobacteriota bacterium]
MTNQVLIIGGTGRIGTSVATDIANHTQAKITITGRRDLRNEISGSNFSFLQLDLTDKEAIKNAIVSLKENSDDPSSPPLVIHCAGPFFQRDAAVLKTCIEEGVNYVDVSDNRKFTSLALDYSDAAANAGITAIINTGIFPGISNSLVRQCIDQLDEAEKIHLSYVVGGSGGAGLTVMRTTFLGLQNPFEVWMDGRWKSVTPYSDREVIEFPQPYGKIGVYWFDMPECFTLANAFPVKSVITKFGSFPDYYNYMTWIVANWWPSSWLQNPKTIEFLSQVSYKMTEFTDRFSGIGVAVKSKVSGIKDGKPASFSSSLLHENTAIAAGIGTGTIAELILSGELNKPGVFPPEEVLTTDLFEGTMESRGLSRISEENSFLYRQK